MVYTLFFTDSAINDLKRLKKAGEKAVLKKIEFLLDELSDHPLSGTGKPKPLGNNRSGQWSRRITDKHRLVYLVDETESKVIILAALGHYDDK
jgi:toxin YoeB